MCAQFLIKSRVKDLAKKFGLILPPDFDADEKLDERILPYREAPVVVKRGGAPALAKMFFSLVPSWSKEPKVKFATHNARIESVAEKPTWKKPFASQRCLVPLTHFIEPIYINKFAGNMVQFHQADDSLLAAAGVYDVWTNKETGEVRESFAILTEEPPQFVAETGHDRCPIFLREEIFSEWLAPEKKASTELFALIEKSHAILKLDVKIDRPLAKGWEKRI